MLWFFGFDFLIYLLFSTVIFWINHSLCLHGGKTFFCSFCMANNLLFPTCLVILLFTPHLLSRRWTMSWKFYRRGVSDPFSSAADHNKLLEKASIHSSSVSPGCASLHKADHPAKNASVSSTLQTPQLWVHFYPQRRYIYISPNKKYFWILLSPPFKHVPQF